MKSSIPQYELHLDETHLQPRLQAISHAHDSHIHHSITALLTECKSNYATVYLFLMLNHGKLYTKGTTYSQLTFDRDCTAMQLHQMLDDG